MKCKLCGEPFKPLDSIIEISHLTKTLHHDARGTVEWWHEDCHSSTIVLKVTRTQVLREAHRILIGDPDMCVNAEINLKILHPKEYESIISSLPRIILNASTKMRDALAGREALVASAILDEVDNTTSQMMRR
ncbi:MAG: hypothetical protein BV459_01480 [Thermoplasmata archaeon M11B2D]|nr:MAG: hypothetical protein BV459_01480 [Thermoplasmata archaeon M11B2D]